MVSHTQAKNVLQGVDNTVVHVIYGLVLCGHCQGRKTTTTTMQRYFGGIRRCFAGGVDVRLFLRGHKRGVLHQVVRESAVLLRVFWMDCESLGQHEWNELGIGTEA